MVPMFGYHGDPKQHSHSPCENVGLINVPLVAVNAADDPFSPAEGRSRNCTRKGLATPRTIINVTSLAILRTVTARGKLAGVTNDKLL